MANIEWIGTAPGNEGNPTIAANWTGGVVPGAADYVWINNNSQAILGADQSAVTVKGIFIQPSFKQNIGASGNTWRINTSEKLIHNGGGAECWITGTHPYVAAAPAVDKANAFQLDGTITLLAVSGGRVTVVSGATVTEAALFAGRYGPAPTLVIPSGVTMTDLAVEGGEAQISSGVSGQIVVTGGLLRHVLGTQTEVVVCGGTYLWEDGTITLLKALGGEFDASKFSSVRTLTNAQIYNGARVDLWAQHSVQLTNEPRVYGTPILRLPDGSQITIAA